MSTATRPICPIPPDAREGDIAISRDGSRHEIKQYEDAGDDVGLLVDGHAPAGFEWDGTAWFNHPEWDCVGFIYADGRKPNITAKSWKPAKTQAQKDAAYLRACLSKWRKQPDFTPAQFKRILAIIERMEGAV